MKNINILFILIIAVFSTNIECLAQIHEQTNNIKLQLNNGSIEAYYSNKKFAEIESFSFNHVQTEIMDLKIEGDNAEILLKFQDDDGYNDNHIRKRNTTFPEEIIVDVSMKDRTLHFTANHVTFGHVNIKMKDLDESYFGLIENLYPENNKNPNLRGEVVDLEVYPGYIEGYASAFSAFFMSSSGYGSFFDTFAKGRYQFAINDITEISHNTGKLDWYLFYGPTGDVIHSAYYRVIGEPKSVPMWALGPIIWRDENLVKIEGEPIGSKQIIDDLQKFSDLEIPLTATFVDRPYSNGAHRWSEMDFSDEFSNPEKWISKINNEYGMEFLTWIAPMTFADKDFPGLLPNYKSYMDLTNPHALEEFKRRLSKQYEVGVKGHKMDRADENFPVSAKWYESISESTARNKYVYLYSKVIDEFLGEAHGKDQFNFARAAFHRSQPYLSAIWGGDSRSNWKGMAGSMANAIRSSFIGFPVWGNDTGGYIGDGYIDKKLYMRWLQWGAWNGMFQIKIDGASGRGKDRAPWRYTKDLQDVFRNATEQRMNLLPYIYSLTNSSAQNGVLMKPMAYMYPFDDNTHEIWDQYFFGNAFLVAPLFSEKNTRNIYLPDGTWYDFNKPSRVYNGAKTISMEVPLDFIPVFVKGNSIYVTGDIFRGNSKIWKGEFNDDENLTIHIFPTDKTTQTKFIYIDYLDGDKMKELVMERKAELVKFTSPALTVDTKLIIRWDSRPNSIKFNGTSVKFEYDKGEKLAVLEIPKNEKIMVLVELQK